MSKVMSKLLKYRKQFKSTIMWRISKHARVVEENLHDGEEILYVFGGQNNLNHFHIFNTHIVVLTNERLIIAQKHLIVGYNLISVTPDLFNDLQIISGLIWGTVIIDTVKEVIYLTNISKRSLPQIQKVVTKFMINEKKKYLTRKTEK